MDWLFIVHFLSVVIAGLIWYSTWLKAYWEGKLDGAGNIKAVIEYSDLVDSVLNRHSEPLPLPDDVYGHFRSKLNEEFIRLADDHFQQIGVPNGIRQNIRHTLKERMK